MDILVDLADGVELFHDAGGVGYADVQVADHRETLVLGRGPFRRWLTRGYYKQTGSAPSGDALTAAISTLQAKAHFDGPEREVFIRLAEHDDSIYIDLCDPGWRVVEVDQGGWRTVADPPVRFRREPGMLPLPAPKRGGEIADLAEFLNLRLPGEGEADPFVLVAAWLLASMRPTGPYPVLILTGEQGTAKSTATRILRNLIDPNSTPLRSLPSGDRDLFVAAQNSWVMCFDNVSSLTPAMSDALCRLSTGGGFATRQLFSDADEVLFEAMRPQLHNGIGGITGRSDLLDRSIVISLEPISDANRRTEAELKNSFKAAHPRLFGALLDGLALGLRKLPSVKLSRKPRMADFAEWAVACEGAYANPGEFMQCFEDQRGVINADAMAQDPVADAIRRMVFEKKHPRDPEFDMIRLTATDLLTSLRDGLPKTDTGQTIVPSGWPQGGRGMAEKLRRIAPILRRGGISIDFERDRDKRLIVQISRQH